MRVVVPIMAMAVTVSVAAVLIMVVMVVSHGGPLAGLATQRYK